MITFVFPENTVSRADMPKHISTFVFQEHTVTRASMRSKSIREPEYPIHNDVQEEQTALSDKICQYVAKHLF